MHCVFDGPPVSMDSLGRVVSFPQGGTVYGGELKVRAVGADGSVLGEVALRRASVLSLREFPHAAQDPVGSVSDSVSLVTLPGGHQTYIIPADHEEPQIIHPPFGYFAYGFVIHDMEGVPGELLIIA